MKSYLLVFCTFLLLFILACAPVLSPDIMKSALRDIELPIIQQKPELYEGKLFVMGGIVAGTKVTAEGSLIEAMYVPVDSRGYLTGVGTSQMRLLAVFPKKHGILDPLIFKKEREITFAGEFLGLREGRIDEMDYTYPYFRIVEIYLWPEKKEYSIYYEPYPYGWDYPFWYRPYWSPYPYRW